MMCHITLIASAPTTKTNPNKSFYTNLYFFYPFESKVKIEKDYLIVRSSKWCACIAVQKPSTNAMSRP